MRRFGYAVLFLVMSLGPVSASDGAEPWEGMDMVRYCTGDVFVFDESVCRAYLQGVIDAQDYFQVRGGHPKAFCIPKDQAARERGVKMISQWLNDFSERLEDPSIELAADFLHTLFPCQTPAGE